VCKSGDFRHSAASALYPEHKNVELLRMALMQVTGQWDEVNRSLPPETYISDAVMAYFEACPGIYSGPDTAAKCSLLPEYQGKTILTLDFAASRAEDNCGYVECYQDGQPLELSETVTNDYIKRQLAAGAIVVVKHVDHWQRVESARGLPVS